MRHGYMERSASKGQYGSRLDDLKKLGDPIIRRFNEYTHLPDIINELVNTRAQYEQWVDNSSVTKYTFFWVIP